MNETARYELVELKNGVSSIRSLVEGETFHPVIGPMAEAEALYVDQLDLRARMRAEPAEFVLWDVGLGGGANVLTVLDRTRGCGGQLRIISFDRTLEPLCFALRHAGVLGYFSGYERQVRQLIETGTADFVDGGRRVVWEFRPGDFPALMAASAPGDLPPPHAVFYDAYSPARNPEMWTLTLFTRLSRHLSPKRPCALPTYSRSTLLRVTLLLAGFHVGAGHATGEKEETTMASNVPTLVAQPLGGDWLRRATASTSAEPLVEPVYRQAPLSEESLKRLFEHPQFRLVPVDASQIARVARAVPSVADLAGRSA